MDTLKQTIQVGQVKLTLKKNRQVFNRYEGFTATGRVLIRQDPWGTWSGCIVCKESKGCLINAPSCNTPEEVGQLLIEKANEFDQILVDFVGKGETPTGR